MDLNIFFKLFFAYSSTVVIIIGNVQSRIQPIDTAPNCFRALNICPNENVIFQLYTRDGQPNGIELNLHNSTELNQQLAFKEKPIKISMHGLSGNLDDNFNIELRKAFFQHDFYVISVNWSKLAVSGCALTGTKNARVVGNCTADLIDKMVLYAGISLENIHVIGFSLGAQTIAFISPYLYGGKQVNHLTALDPTLPTFNTSDLSQRLDPTDATFVEVHHTAADSHSFIDPIGHIDFYWNDGENQPGCEELDKTEYAPGYDHMCSHYRAYEYYALSVHPNVEFYGKKCKYDGVLPLENCNSQTTIKAGYPVPPNSLGVWRVNADIRNTSDLNLFKPVVSGCARVSTLACIVFRGWQINLSIDYIISVIFVIILIPTIS